MAWGKRGRIRVTKPAFSLVELVIVVVIIGIITGIAVPRIVSASQRAQANALMATLTEVRKAIDHYYAEHGLYPGYIVSNGSSDGDQFVEQLTHYSDAQGNTNSARESPFLFGPYLGRSFPKNPFNGLDTVHVRAQESDPTPAAGSVGWLAVLSTGAFDVDATEDELTGIGFVGTSASSSGSTGFSGG